ncbi:MAG TPA: CpaD family pilus assembly lipoprotein [Lacipirellulaceae bacterium]|nr:CpaD family pilus assembly lipoprotein [Lacipirellulaceae bacterium]
MVTTMRALPLAALLAAAVGLTACGDSAPEWSPVEAPKTNSVSVVRQEHIVRFDHGRSELSPHQAAQLAEFLGRQSGQGASAAAISVGPGTGPSGIGAGRERALRAALARRGYNQVDVVYTGTDTGGVNQAAVSVNRYVVTTPRCPNFSKAPEYNYTNTTYSNFGCASAQNLGVMVADPADLVRGRPEGAQDGAGSVLGIQRYRAGATRPLMRQDTGSTTGGQ